jgi:hypothetical protein
MGKKNIHVERLKEQNFEKLFLQSLKEFYLSFFKYFFYLTGMGNFIPCILSVRWIIVASTILAQSKIYFQKIVNRHNKL